MLMNSLNQSGSQLCLLLLVFALNAALVPFLAPISLPLFLLYAAAQGALTAIVTRAFGG